MCHSPAVYGPSPGSVQQRAQATEDNKGATDGTTYGSMSALFEARRGVLNVTNDVVVISGHCNPALNRRQYFCWVIGLG